MPIYLIRSIILLVVVLTVSSCSEQCDADPDIEHQEQTSLHERELHKLVETASSKNPDAELAVFSYIGDNIEHLGQHREVGLQFLQKAAVGNSAEAQLILGSLLDNGTVLEADKEAALYWYLLSAQQGNLDAQLLVAGEFYLQASELDDHEKSEDYLANSIRWYKIAAANGSAVGKGMYAEVLAGQTETRSEGIRLLGDIAVTGDSKAVETLLFMRETAKDLEREVIGGDLSVEESRESYLAEILAVVQEIDEQLKRAEKSKTQTEVK